MVGMTKTQGSAVAVVLSLLIAFGGGVYAGVSERQSFAATSTSFANPADIDMQQFWEAYQVLNTKFVMSNSSSTLPTTQEQIYGAISGLARSFGDPYTVFLPPSDAQVFQEDISGSFGGVGMEIDNNADGDLVVVAPLKDSPAERAGIRSGDIIARIGTTSAISIDSNEAIKLIRGPKGTPIELTFLRPGESEPRVVSVVRDTISIPVLKSYKRDDGIFVIELYSFSQNSSNLFRNALREFVLSGSSKLLLDLRGNPGGYLEASVSMASYFLPVGDIVVTEDFKGKQQNTIHRSLGYNVFANKKGFKMAVLINQGSASASEILAGALAQHGVAKTVGTRTFGKGSVQQLVELGGGAELKITIARWLTPNGMSISDGGLVADIQVERTAKDVEAGKDPQTDAAVKYLLGR